MKPKRLRIQSALKYQKSNEMSMDNDNESDYLQDLA